MSSPASWTKEKIDFQILCVCQPNSMYEPPAGLSAMRNNMVVEQWPDEVLQGVIKGQPLDEPRARICQDELGKRAHDRTAQADLLFHKETRDALAKVERAVQVGTKLHWSYWVIFGVTIITLLLTVFQVWPNLNPFH
jgi:hypothetical protein